MTPPPVARPATVQAEVSAPVPGTGASRLRRPAGSILADRTYLLLTLGACVAAVTGIVYLIFTTAAQTGDVWDKVGTWNFLTGTEWIPFPADRSQGVFGAVPFVYGTLVTSSIAMVIAVPTAIGIGLATTIFLPRRLRGPVAVLIDLLAAIPSVVYGLWGTSVLVPLVKPALEALAGGLGGLSLAGWRPFEGPVIGQSYLLAGLVLGLMVLPIITAVTREVLLTVPSDQREGALALGATRWETVRHSVLPWARSGIVGASALGLGRAVGETIAIVALLGNSPGIFDSLLGPGATLASVIANEAGEASDLQLSALTALAIVLFVIAFLINAAARLLVSRTAAGPGMVRRAAARIPRRGAQHERSASDADLVLPRSAAVDGGLTRVSRSRRVRQRLAVGFIYVSLLVGLVPLGAVIGEMLAVGLPAISVDFFTELPPLDPTDFSGGISNALVGTLILMGIALAAAAPLGVLSALFVAEYATSGSPVLRRGAHAVGFIVDILLGVPSIVVGLIVYLGVVLAQGHYSALAGGLALGIIMFPIVVRSADEVLRLVPIGHKEAGLALGAPRWRLTWSVVLPAAIPGIVTGIMLALARASGETAPLLFTSLGSQFLSTDIFAPIASIPQLIFTNTIVTQTEASLQHAWGATLVLVTIILVLNLGARLVSRRFRDQEAR
jgi:phosphate transport system permease protein